MRVQSERESELSLSLSLARVMPIHKRIHNVMTREKPRDACAGETVRVYRGSHLGHCFSVRV